jgi:hypothetical protein
MKSTLFLACITAAVFFRNRTNTVPFGLPLSEDEGSVLIAFLKTL